MIDNSLAFTVGDELTFAFLVVIILVYGALKTSKGTVVLETKKNNPKQFLVLKKHVLIVYVC